MTTISTSEIFKAAHKKASYEFRMSRGRSFYFSPMSYRQIFGIMLKKQWEAAKAEAEPVQSFTIALEYKETKLRDKVKALGGRWNAESKTWSVSCKKHQLGSLEDKVVSTGYSNVSSVRTYAKKETRSNYCTWSYSEQVLAGIYVEND